MANNVTIRERAEITRELQAIMRVERLGALEARRITAKLRRGALQALRDKRQFTTGPNVATSVERDLLALLEKAMKITALMGWKRSILQRRREEITLRLDLLSDTLDRLLYTTTYWDDSEALQFLDNAIGSKIIQSAVKLVRDTAQETQIKIREKVNELIRQGATARDGQKALQETFTTLGIDGQAPYRLEQIFRTQTQLAHNAAAWQDTQRPEIDEILWGYKYVTVGDDRVRAEHEAWDGVTLPKNDPFWNQHWPPNGYNCRCMTIPIYEEREITRPRRMADGTEAQVHPDFAYNPGQLPGARVAVPTPKVEKPKPKPPPKPEPKPKGETELERLTRERQQKEQAERERLAREQAERTRLEQERLARLEAERLRREAEQAERRRKFEEAQRQAEQRFKEKEKAEGPARRAQLSDELDKQREIWLKTTVDSKAEKAALKEIARIEEQLYNELKEVIAEQTTQNQELENVRQKVLKEGERTFAIVEKEIEAQRVVYTEAVRRKVRAMSDLEKAQNKPKKIDKAKEEYKKASEEYEREKSKLEALQGQREPHIRARKALAYQGTTTTANTVNDGLENDFTKRNIRVAQEFVTSLVPETQIPAIELTYKKDTTGRAGYYRQTKDISISEAESAAVIAHEIGHHLEYNIQNAQAAAKAFIKMRIERSGTPTVKMQEQFPTAKYGDFEEGNKDDFEKLFGVGDARAYYAGKTYASGSTEIISMGVELLYDDPVRFAQLDPEYFNFVIGVLRGEIK